MKILKFICFLFLIYFMRRMYQLYVFWKAQHDLKDAQLKAAQMEQQRAEGTKTSGHKVVDADFKVVD